MTIVEVPGALAGERLDRAVATVGDVSRSRAAALIADGRVQVNGAVVTTRSRRLEEGDQIVFEVVVAERTPMEADPGVEVRVVHEDADVIVVDKPAGLVVHPGSGNPGGTLVNGLLARYPEIAGIGSDERPGIVHRLDRGTSGLLVVARDPAAYDSLVDQLGARSVSRQYRALTWGCIADGKGLIEAPVGRARRDPTRMAVTGTGKDALTRYEVDELFTDPADLSLVVLHLDTGRTHQIRVHLAAIGHPVVGDDRYGGRRGDPDPGRPFLHAEHLAFDHPSTRERLEFSSVLPDDLATLLSGLS